MIARDVVPELLDRRLLVVDDGLHDVADRDDAGQPAVVEHEQVPAAVLGHERHAPIDAGVDRDVDQGVGQDIAHARLPRSAPFEHDLARIVALREQAERAIALHHDERAAIVCRHLAQRVEHGCIRRHMENVTPLLPQYGQHGDHCRIRECSGR